MNSCRLDSQIFDTTTQILQKKRENNIKTASFEFRSFRKDSTLVTPSGKIWNGLQGRKRPKSKCIELIFRQNWNLAAPYKNF